MRGRDVPLIPSTFIVLEMITSMGAVSFLNHLSCETKNSDKARENTDCPTRRLDHVRVESYIGKEANKHEMSHETTLEWAIQAGYEVLKAADGFMPSFHSQRHDQSHS